MTVENKNGQAMLETVQAVVKKHGATPEELIPILSDLNRELGYLPGPAMAEVSRLLRVPQSQLFSVASFYRMLSTKPRGRHVIQFCESAPCHVVGGRQVWEALRKELTLDEDQTSTDGKWTLITTSCLGLCSVGPVVVIDDDVYGNVSPDQIPAILGKYS
ncbi:MAG TPA: NAD(P)H-dependent oxidoreductase subunit E [Anaerolineaceae bacterium]|nr:NAD(P)H-dependent oxidoreductase subunit E [Anaerolineaceae bacterium]